MYCSAEGLSWVIPDGFTLPMPRGGQLDIMLMAAGEFLPPHEQLQIDAWWQTQQEIEVQYTTRRGRKVTLWALINILSTVVDDSTVVTVPAGNFDAWQIDQEITIMLTSQDPRADEFTKIIDMSGRRFLAESVGPIKREVTGGDGFEMLIELEGYSMP
jgi:hypothetical protein